MKKIIGTLFAAGIFLTAKAQSVAGDWEGTLNVQGTEIPIVFHIKDSAGKLSASFDSPKQMAYNLACSAVFLRGDSLILQMKMMGGKYESLLSADKKTARGTWFQGGGSLPLDIKKTNDIATKQELKRPQTPKPPYPYTGEDVLYFNADKSIQFGATFTHPADETKTYPVALLITGSSQQDRDETIFEHKSFAVIADYLTRQGIAVLRVDDRGAGKTTGNFSNSTTADFANDVEAGIEYLRSRKEVDVANIGLIGHSEGGIIAPMVASRRKDIRFIVLLAGPAVPIIDLMTQQNVDVMAAAGIARTDLDYYASFYKNIVTAILHEKDAAAAKKTATDIFNQWQNNTPAAVVLNTTHVTDEKTKTAFINQFVSQLKSTWFNYFMQIDPSVYLKNIHCAVLALNGDKDVQVAAKPNLEAIRSVMVDKKVKTFKVQAMPGLNHLFQHCHSCSTDEYGLLEETFAPEVLQIMGEWIKGVVTR